MSGAGKISVNNFGSTNNAVSVSIGELDLHFSYETLVAYWDPPDGLVVCENIWSKTTGKHLNIIDGGEKKERYKKDEFERMVAAMLKRHNLEQEK